MKKLLCILLLCLSVHTTQSINTVIPAILGGVSAYTHEGFAVKYENRTNDNQGVHFSTHMTRFGHIVYVASLTTKVCGADPIIELSLAAAAQSIYWTSAIVRGFESCRRYKIR